MANITGFPLLIFQPLIFSVQVILWAGCSLFGNSHWLCSTYLSVFPLSPWEFFACFSNALSKVFCRATAAVWGMTFSDLLSTWLLWFFALCRHPYPPWSMASSMSPFSESFPVLMRWGNQNCQRCSVCGWTLDLYPTIIMSSVLVPFWSSNNC